MTSRSEAKQQREDVAKLIDPAMFKLPWSANKTTGPHNRRAEAREKADAIIAMLKAKESNGSSPKNPLVLKGVGIP